MICVKVIVMSEEGKIKKLLESMTKEQIEAHVKKFNPEAYGSLFSGVKKKLYTEEDMEAAFTGGGANAAKFRVSGNKLTLPCYEFPEWLKKYNNK